MKGGWLTSKPPNSKKSSGQSSSPSLLSPYISQTSPNLKPISLGNPDMEVLISTPPTDFNFDSACSSPYISAPSSPKRFGSDFYFSAPTSPTHAASIYRSFNNLYNESPSKSNHQEEEEEEDDDFAFNFSGQLSRASLSADELFVGGKIRPLQTDNRSDELRTRNPRSPRLPRSPKEKNSPRNEPEERGRERVSAFSAMGSSRRATRSLSPYRNTNFFREEQQQNRKPTSSTTKSSSKKWSLKDLLLFRSASEGRATSKDPLRKYSLLPKKTERSRSGSRRKGGPVSAHELHYTSNRAVAEEMKRKTVLPYKQGLFGWLGFGPTVHGPIRGFTRG